MFPFSLYSRIHQYFYNSLIQLHQYQRKQRFSFNNQSEKVYQRKFARPFKSKLQHRENLKRNPNEFQVFEKKNIQLPDNLIEGSAVRESNRAKFNNIVVDRSFINYLDTIKLGHLPRRRQRIVYSKKFNILESNPLYNKKIEIQNTAPHVFRKVGYDLKTISTAEEVLGVHFVGNPPEIAIIGRSNVGKSSLLNRLLGFDSSYTQKSTVSDKPGTTKDIKFYGVQTKKARREFMENTRKQSISLPVMIDVKDKNIRKQLSPMSLVIADMPGYGFAYMNDIDKQRCTELCRQYLLQRGNVLKRVLLLIDARHGLKFVDKEYFYTLFNSSDGLSLDSLLKPRDINWKLQIILTKCDLLSRLDIARRIQQIHDSLSEVLPGLGNLLPILAVSSLEGKGFIRLQKELNSLVPQSHRVIDGTEILNDENTFAEIDELYYNIKDKENQSNNENELRIPSKQSNKSKKILKQNKDTFIDPNVFYNELGDEYDDYGNVLLMNDQKNMKLFKKKYTNEINNEVNDSLELKHLQVDKSWINIEKEKIINLQENQLNDKKPKKLNEKKELMKKLFQKKSKSVANNDNSTPISNKSKEIRSSFTKSHFIKTKKWNIKQ